MTQRTPFHALIPVPLVLSLLCGTFLRCDKQGSGGSTDLSMATGADLATVVDLATSMDQSPVPDLTSAPDLAGTPGDRCVIALPLPADNVTRDGDTSKGFTDDYQFMNTAAACSSASSTYKGKDVVYSVTVPAGKTLTVTLTPKLLAGTWYPMLALIADCATPGPSCLAAQDTVIPNSKDRVVTYQNVALTDRTLFVMVDTFDATGSGQYSIKATLS